ncbi:MAG: IS66 family transposase [Pirellulaceae bacterium]|nr:MAG: IS66 family transposase [Pirellulaceae bacterium]
MDEWKHLTRHELIALLLAKDEQLRQKDIALQEKDIALQEKERELQKVREQAAGWEHAYRRLWERFVRPKRERYIDPNQKLLFSEEASVLPEGQQPEVPAEPPQETVKQYTRRRPKKKQEDRFPDHLPRKVEVVHPDAAQCTCCEHGERKLLDEKYWDKTETLEYTPPQLHVLVRLYPKYVCPNHPECGVLSANRPNSLVAGDKYAPSLAAKIIAYRYSYHLPLYRQQNIFAGCGWEPHRSTQWNIVRSAADVIAPLVGYYRQVALRDSVLGVDDTRVTMVITELLPDVDPNEPRHRRALEVLKRALDRGMRSITARMWAYRPVTTPLVVFDFTVSQHRDGPAFFLGDYQGILLGDCWSGYDGIIASSNGKILQAACNAHARRKIFDSQAYPQERDQWLRWFQKLYDIEERGRHLPEADRLELRRREARAVWDRMWEWILEADRRVSNVILRTSDFGKAIHYIRTHFRQLTLYLDHPQVPIDNNDTEQQMKHVATGRKNWLFVQSLSAAERSANLLTLVRSAERNHLDVWYFVKDVLEQLLAGQTNYEELLPWRWAEKHPDRIRHFRIRENERRANARRRHRQERRLVNDTS